MYNLPYFKEKDRNTLIRFVKEHPFAFLAGCSPDGKPVATQVPVFLEEREGQFILTGHIMRQTDHHRAFENNDEVLCVFTGPHTYVSASWYSDPHQASTWNYMSVHLQGKIRFLDEAGLETVLRKTTLHFENQDTQSPTVYDNLPANYRNRLMKAIIAFEVVVTGMENVFKLSQNRDAESYDNIIRELDKGDADGKAVSEEMKKRKDELFG